MKIEKAFMKLIKDKNINEITITELVKETKINRSTFYEHYKVKDELLKDVIVEATQDLEKHLALVEEASSPKESYLQLMESLFTYMEENQFIFTIFPNKDDTFQAIQEIVQKKYEEILDKTSKSSTKISNHQKAIFYVEC